MAASGNVFAFLQDCVIATAPHPATDVPHMWGQTYADCLLFTKEVEMEFLLIC